MAYLRRQPFVLADRIGMTGYCFGGGVTGRGDQGTHPARRRRRTTAPPTSWGRSAPSSSVLGVYAENDTFVNPQLDQIRAGLAAARAPSRVTVYPNAGHAFFNDTRPQVYVDGAATAAGRDTLAWFGTYLRAGGLPWTGDGSGTRHPGDPIVAPAEA